MTDPALEKQAQRALHDAVGKHLDDAALPLHTLAAQGTPSGDDLKALLAQNSAAPAAAGGRHRTGPPVSQMSRTDRLVEAFELAPIDKAVRAQIVAAIQPPALAGAVLIFAGLFLVSQFTPVGWAEDIAIGITTFFVGTALLSAAEHLMKFAAAADATTDEELFAAADAFASACADIEVNALLYLITKKPGRTADLPPAKVPNSADVILAERNGERVVIAKDAIPSHVSDKAGLKEGSGTGGPPGQGGQRPPGGGEDPPGGPRGRAPGSKPAAQGPSQTTVTSVDSGGRLPFAPPDSSAVASGSHLHYVDSAQRPLLAEGWVYRKAGGSGRAAGSDAAQKAVTGGAPGNLLHGAHLFPDKFGGAGIGSNIVKFSADANQSSMSVVENAIEGYDQATHGNVYLQVYPRYADPGVIPASVTYRIWTPGPTGELALKDELTVDFDNVLSHTEPPPAKPTVH